MKMVNDVETLNLPINTGGVDPNSVDSDRSVAAKSGNFEAVRFLVEMGRVNPDLIHSNGWSPLCPAADCGDLTVVRCLDQIAKYLRSSSAAMHILRS